MIWKNNITKVTTWSSFCVVRILTIVWCNEGKDPNHQCFHLKMFINPNIILVEMFFCLYITPEFVDMCIMYLQHEILDWWIFSDFESNTFRQLKFGSVTSPRINDLIWFSFENVKLYYFWFDMKWFFDLPVRLRGSYKDLPLHFFHLHNEQPFHRNSFKK